MFKSQKPTGQPRTLRGIAEEKNDPGKFVDPGETGNAIPYSDPVDATVKVAVAFPPVAQPTPFRLGGGK